MEEAIEHTLRTVNQCFAFQIPPQVSANGHRAEDWPKDHAWVGKLVISVRGDTLLLKLVDSNTGALFAACPVARDAEEAVQKVTDSSRYFVLRVVDEKSGRHAFIGIAFENRTDAFEFNVTIKDHLQQLQREQKAAETPPPPQNYSLSAGQKIHVKLGAALHGNNSNIVTSRSSKKSKVHNMSDWEKFT